MSTCWKDIKELNIESSLEEIKVMKRRQFQKMVKEKIREGALKYLLQKRGSKGKEIVYNSLEMADYLLPFNTMKITEKQNIFSIRNRMIDIKDNFGKSDNCICGSEENMNHTGCPRKN